MFKKPLLIATMVATLGAATLSTEASAGDPVLGALIGGGIGAAIGHDVNHHNGAVVGGVLGAIVGSSIAANSGPYYGDSGYYAPSPGYFAPAPSPGYFAPAPVYYGAPVYRSRAVYVAPRYVRHYDRHDHRYYR
jgi:hypothetical protein